MWRRSPPRLSSLRRRAYSARRSALRLCRAQLSKSLILSYSFQCFIGCPPYICEHLWESFLCKRFCVFRAFSGNICPPTDFTDLHRWSVCAELNHRLSGNYCANLTTSPSHHHNILSPSQHPFTTTTSFHHLNTLSLRTQPSAGLPNTAGTTSLPPAAR